MIKFKNPHTCNTHTWITCISGVFLCLQGEPLNLGGPQAKRIYLRSNTFKAKSTGKMSGKWPEFGEIRAKKNSGILWPSPISPKHSKKCVSQLCSNLAPFEGPAIGRALQPKGGPQGAVLMGEKPPQKHRPDTVLKQFNPYLFYSLLFHALHVVVKYHVSDNLKEDGTALRGGVQ